MPVNTALAVNDSASDSLYRITAVSFNTANATHYKKVVYGMGARKSHSGARYNFGKVQTVFLAASLQTCLAEKMFYFQQEIVRRLDALHQPLSPGLPAFSSTFTLWDIRLKKALPNYCPARTICVPFFASSILSLASAPGIHIKTCIDWRRTKSSL